MGFVINYEEGQTPIAEAERRGLKLPLSTQGELDEVEQLNIEKAMVWLLGQEFTAEQVLTETFMKKLHKKMFAEIWKWAGKFRQTEKNIGVPWVQVGRKLKILCDDALFWVEHETFPPKEIALRFKHRLVSIHCFPNGNGRHSRMMADVLMEQVFGLPAFSWSAGNLISATEERKIYIAALRAADQQDMGPLLDFA
jgi:Fic-DOC domain mobile mystery protein B